MRRRVRARAWSAACVDHRTAWLLCYHVSVYVDHLVIELWRREEPVEMITPFQAAPGTAFVALRCLHRQRGALPHACGWGT